MLKKRVLIVDDNPIDREVLKNIISEPFDVFETDNGYSAVQMAINKKFHIDAMLLDITMPIIDGFEVLRLLNENGINDIPVILITSEATLSNVIRAKESNAADFIRKPFESISVLSKLCAIFDCEMPKNIKRSHILTLTNIADTNAYIRKLLAFCETFKKNITEDTTIHYRNIKHVMRIMLEEHVISDKKLGLDDDHIEIISSAAMFHDIGIMFIPERLARAYRNVDMVNGSSIDKVYTSHTILGAELISLNAHPSCGYFVEIASDMCMHHHERIDGTGYPHGVKGDDLSLYTKMCAVASVFDQEFSHLSEYNESRFNVVLNEMKRPIFSLDYDVLEILERCQHKLIRYYSKLTQS